jgi:hypothetical protein
LNLLVDLDTLFGLLLLHAMLPSWPYAWVPCPHQGPTLRLNWVGGLRSLFLFFTTPYTMSNEEFATMKPAKLFFT